MKALIPLGIGVIIMIVSLLIVPHSHEDAPDTHGESDKTELYLSR